METQKTSHAADDRTIPTLAEVVAFCRDLKLTAEQVGGWVWVSFADVPDESLRRSLKDFGFRWSRRRGKWAHNCGLPTRSARQSDPWQKYEHRVVSTPAGPRVRS
jgi:hypothetical protein